MGCTPSAKPDSDNQKQAYTTANTSKSSQAVNPQTFPP